MTRTTTLIALAIPTLLSGCVHPYIVASASLPAHSVIIGDYGFGEPLPTEVSQCQDTAGGEMIYDSVASVWFCES